MTENSKQSWSPPESGTYLVIQEKAWYGELWRIFQSISFCEHQKSDRIKMVNLTIIYETTKPK